MNLEKIDAHRVMDHLDSLSILRACTSSPSSMQNTHPFKSPALMDHFPILIDSLDIHLFTPIADQLRPLLLEYWHLPSPMPYQITISRMCITQAAEPFGHVCAGENSFTITNDEPSSCIQFRQWLVGHFVSWITIS